MNLLQDIRFAFRMLRKAPAFTATAVLTLALGIGVNAAVFSVVNASLLRPLPYPDPDRLMFIGETRADNPYPRQASYPDYVDWRAQASSFQELGAYGNRNVTLTGEGNAERLRGLRVSASFFRVLGIQPALGRFLTDAEESGDSARVVVLTYALWQSHFGGDRSVLGRTLVLNQEKHVVVGVMPPNFEFAKGGDPQLLVPLAPSATQKERRFNHWLWVIGRLRGGAIPRAAQAELNTIAERIAQIDPKWHAATSIGAVPLHRDVTGLVRPVLLLLLGAAACVLLIACANIGNLLLARGNRQHREYAVRAALGASRTRLLQQGIVYSTLLAALGGAVGTLFSIWAANAFVAAVPQSMRLRMPVLGAITPDIRTIAFAVLTTFLTGILVGAVPGLRASRPNLMDALRSAVGTKAAHSHRFQNLLMASEIALCVVLVSGSLLLTSSLVQLLRTNPGFDPTNLLTIQMTMPPAYREGGKAARFQTELLRRIQSLPGVSGATTVDTLPLISGGGTGSPQVEGAPPDENILGNMREVSPNYFQVMRIPLVDGRMFRDEDVERNAQILIINRALARRLFAGGSPLGRRVTFAFTPNTWFEIVGVVGNESVTTLGDADPPAIYFPFTNNTGLSVIIRVAADPAGIAMAVRRIVAEMDSDIPVYGIRTLDEIIAATPGAFTRRYPALLIGLFAGLALLLSMVGVYGVASYIVSMQTREFGVRVALGARASEIISLVLWRDMRWALAGIGVGTVGALLCGRLVSTFLFHTSPLAPLPIAGAVALIGFTSVGAGLFPARRAGRIDPMVALRHDS